MSLLGPLVVVEDDPDDEAILETILEELNFKNKILWFRRADAALEYLQVTTDTPFLIMSDINLPVINGIEFKRKIDQNPRLRQKSIPFVFYSTTVDQAAVNEAYTHMTVQGFFQKPASYGASKQLISMLFTYWQNCRHPNVK